MFASGRLIAEVALLTPDIARGLFALRLSRIAFVHAVKCGLALVTYALMPHVPVYESSSAFSRRDNAKRSRTGRRS